MGKQRRGRKGVKGGMERRGEGERMEGEREEAKGVGGEQQMRWYGWSVANI